MIIWILLVTGFCLFEKVFRGPFLFEIRQSFLLWETGRRHLNPGWFRLAHVRNEFPAYHPNSRKDVEKLVEEFVCVEVLGTVGETEATFGQRLTAFWSEILREIPEEFEKVYAETIVFEMQGKKPLRRYAIEAGGVDLFVGRIRQGGFEVTQPCDDDVYTKYELPATEWWQIEH